MKTPFREQLRKLRTRAGFTQGELEKLLKTKVNKLPSKIISRWETGAKKKALMRWFPLVETIDDVLNAEGALCQAYTDSEDISLMDNPVIQKNGKIIFNFENPKILVKVIKLLTDDLGLVNVIRLIESVAQWIISLDMMPSDEQILQMISMSSKNLEKKSES